MVSNISPLIVELKDDGPFFICLAVVEVSGSSDPQIMVPPLIWASHYAFKNWTKTFWLSIFSKKWLLYVNWKLKCVNKTNFLFLYTVFFSFILFRAVVSKTCFFSMGVFWFLVQIFISTIWANLVCAFLPLECLTLFRTVFIPPWILREDISVSADT